jgi:hypothetical protein
MSISAAVSMSENGAGVQGAVQTSLLRKAQDIQAEGMKAMMESIKSVSPGKGGSIDTFA